MEVPADWIEEYYPEKGYSNDCLTLTAETLEIRYRSHRYILPLAHIDNLELQHVRLLFYFLAGGLMFTLALIAILKNFIAPLPGLMFVVAGATGFYFGWKGKLSLQISTYSHDYVFWFSGKYVPFLNFIQEVQQQIRRQNSLSSEQTDIF